jgi:hypothetical protein
MEIESQLLLQAEIGLSHTPTEWQWLWAPHGWPTQFGSMMLTSWFFFA